MQGDRKTISVNCNCKEAGHELMDNAVCLRENKTIHTISLFAPPPPDCGAVWVYICSHPPLLYFPSAIIRPGPRGTP